MALRYSNRLVSKENRARTTRAVSIAAALMTLACWALLRPDHHSEAQRLLTVSLLVLAAPLAWRTVVDALHLRFATDVIALLCIIASVALGQPVVGIVIVIMQNGGEGLDLYARGRASSALNALESAAPRSANRITDQVVANVPVSAVAIGDLLRINPGDIVPVDGVVVTGASQLDTSTLTGESMPVAVVKGLDVFSGTRNGTGSFEMRATKVAAQSRYAEIVELVRRAQSEKAPLQRLADRYAVWFTPFTLAVCVASFATTGDWSRVLAVLAVATPCPLILAAPVAIIGGINRAARMDMLIKSGTSLERLSDVSLVAFDKTGTLTAGKPELTELRAIGRFDRKLVLEYAASIEAYSSHPFAPIIVSIARAEHDNLPESRDHSETAGAGIEGMVHGSRVRVGSARFVLQQSEIAQPANHQPLASNTYVSDQMECFASIDGEPAGVFVFADPIRPEVQPMFSALGAAGVGSVLLSGDSARHVTSVAQRLGISRAAGDLSPTEKAKLIEHYQAQGEIVMMVGDGVNDAPALSVADVGVAMGSAGQNISSEAADVVLLSNSLQHLTDLLEIGTRTKRIALQSIWWGLGLSATGMILASVGELSPVGGAIAQELIDVAVIVNALRAMSGP